MTAEEIAFMLDAQVTPCGSRVTCNPPPTNTDADFLVVIPDNPQKISQAVSGLGQHGFHWEGTEHYQNAAGEGFMSWRRDDLNLIVTANPVWAEKHNLATALCTKLNLLNKADRVAVFQAVLYGRCA